MAEINAPEKILRRNPLAELMEEKEDEPKQPEFRLPPTLKRKMLTACQRSKLHWNAIFTTVPDVPCAPPNPASRAAAVRKIVCRDCHGSDGKDRASGHNQCKTGDLP
jgi:hypothetical protein